MFILSRIFNREVKPKLWVNGWHLPQQRVLSSTSVCLHLLATWILSWFLSVLHVHRLSRFIQMLFIQVNSWLSSVTQLCLTLCTPSDHSMPGLPVHHKLQESTPTHVHRVGDAIQPCHPLSSPSPLALNLSQYQGLFRWVSSSHQMAKVLEFQLQHQSFQWTPWTDPL